MVRIFPFKKNIYPEFEIKDFTDINKKPNLFNGHNKADFHQLILVSEGSIKLTIDFKELILNGGDAVLISNKQVFGYDIISNVSGKIILFTDIFFNQRDNDLLFLYSCKLLNPNELNVIFTINSSYVNHILKLFDIVLNQPNNPFQERIVHSHLFGLLLEAESSINSCCDNIANQKISRIFFNAVEEDFKISKKVCHYLSKMGVNEKQLSNEVKQITLKTPKEYIDNRVILEAKRKLAYTSMRVNEIGYELGFDEATNFNKFFMKHTKMTPIQFRKNHLS